MKHIVQLSGGKDSTAMLLMMLEKGMPVDEIIFCDTGMEFPAMYEHLQRVEQYTGRKTVFVLLCRTCERKRQKERPKRLWLATNVGALVYTSFEAAANSTISESGR